MVLWDTSPSSSRSAGFPNKVTIPCHNNPSLKLLACCAASRTTLDLVTMTPYCLQDRGQTPPTFRVQESTACLTTPLNTPAYSASNSLTQDHGACTNATTHGNTQVTHVPGGQVSSHSSPHSQPQPHKQREQGDSSDPR